jgi:threonine synthase
MQTFSHRLRCSECDWTSTPDSLRNLCPHCGSPLLVSWDLQPAPALLEEIRGRPASMWRFRDVLPGSAAAEIVSLGEGSTPLLHAHRLGSALHLPHLFVKDESGNPTRSFKARGMSAAVTMAKNLGASVLAAPTAGNAGAALAAYGARAGLECRIAMPADTPRSIVRECHSYGASVTEVEGVITDAGRLVREWVERDGVFDVSTLKEPYRVEGKKTMGYELLLDLDGRLPDLVVYPTGGGTGLIGMWKAFDEMQRLGWIDDRRPRMIAVQSSGCAPIVRAWQDGLDDAPEWPAPRTAAWGLRVPRAVGDRLMLRAIRESGGSAVAVEEADLESAADRLRRIEGIDAGPESGAALLAVEHLAQRGTIGSHEVVVMFNTGGNKYGP